MFKKKNRDYGGEVDLEVDPFEVNPEDGNVVPIEEAIKDGEEQGLNDSDSNGRTSAQLIETGESNSNARTSAHLNLSGIDIALPSDKESLWRYVVDKTNLSAISAAQAGYALLTLKEQSEHGEFKDELIKRGLNIRASQESMQIATTLLNQPEKVQQSLTQMSKSQLITIAKLEPEQIEMMADSDDFDELSALSVRELRAKIRELQHSNEIKELDLVDAKEKVIAARQRSTKFPEEVLHIRAEASLANLMICKQADDLESLLNQMQSTDFNMALDSDPQNADTEGNAALAMVHQAIATSLVRLHRLMDDYKAMGAKEFILEDFAPQLDDEELKRVGAMWNIEKDIANREKAEAKVKRTNEARKGKRGRPVKNAV